MLLDLPAFKRDYLRDMPLADAKGRPLTDPTYQNRLKSVVASFERAYAVSLSPCHVKLGDEALSADPELLPSNDPAYIPLIAKDAVDFDPRSFEGDRYVHLRLPLGPVVRVLGIGMKLPGMSHPAEYQLDWIQLKKRRKVIDIYPGRTVSAMPFGAGGWAMLALNSARVIPNAWQIVYLAGYTADQLAGQDADVYAAICKLLALDLLIPGSADIHLNAGVSGRSVSVDGLSQNTNLMQNANKLKFGPLIDAYQQSYAEWAKMYEFRRSGPKFGVL
jgi:hypothetical protein